MLNRKKIVISAIVLSLLTHILAPIPQASALSDAPVMKISIQSRAMSYYYYHALKACIRNHSDDLFHEKGFVVVVRYFKDAEAKAGKWWSTGEGIGDTSKAAVAGTYLDKSVPMSGLNGSTLCNTVVEKAAGLWKTTPLDLLCGMTTGTDSSGNNRYIGVYRDHGQDCKTGGSDFIGKFTDSNMTMLLNFIKKQIYTSSSGSVMDIGEAMGPQAGQYFMWYAALTNGCGYKVNESAGSGSNVIDDVPIINPDTGEITISKMSGTKSKTDSVNAYSDGNRSEIGVTCQQLVTSMKSLADKASSFIKTEKSNGGTPAGSETDVDCEADPRNSQCASATDSEDATETCNVEGVGWIVCPVMSFFGKLMDAGFTMVKQLIALPPTVLDSDGGAKRAWDFFRDIANIILVIAFMFIVYSQLTGLGISNYGIKQMLPKIIIVAILINISFYLCQLAVDVSNIVGESIYKVLTDIPVFENDGEEGFADGSSTFTYVVGAVLAGGAAVTGAAAVGTVTVASIVMAGGLTVLVPVIIVGLFALMAIVFVIISRPAILVMLTIVSPVVIASTLLPNMRGIQQRWTKYLVSLLTLFPMVAFLMGGSRLAALILAQSMGFTDWGNIKDQIGAGLSVAAAMALPLVAIFPMIKGSLNAIPAVGSLIGSIQRMGSKTASLASKKMEESKGLAASMAQANPSSRRWRMLNRGLNGSAFSIGNRRLVPSRLRNRTFGATQATLRQYGAAAKYDSDLSKATELQLSNDIKYNKDGGLTTPEEQVSILKDRLVDYATNGKTTESLIASQMLRSKGEPGRVAYHQALADIDTKMNGPNVKKADKVDFRATTTGQAMASRDMSDGIKGTDNAINKYWTAPKDKDGNRASLSQIDNGNFLSGLTDKEIAGQSKKALRAAAANGNIDYDTAQRILNSGSKDIQLDGERREIFNGIPNPNSNGNKNSSGSQSGKTLPPVPPPPSSS